MLKTLKLATVAALLAVPITVHAQDIFGAMERGALEGMERGDAAAGPIGGIVGVVVGSVVGAANGVIDVNPGPQIYEHRSVYRDHRHHRYH